VEYDPRQRQHPRPTPQDDPGKTRMGHTLHGVGPQRVAVLPTQPPPPNRPAPVHTRRPPPDHRVLRRPAYVEYAYPVLTNPVPMPVARPVPMPVARPVPTPLPLPAAPPAPRPEPPAAGPVPARVSGPVFVTPAPPPRRRRRLRWTLVAVVVLASGLVLGKMNAQSKVALPAGASAVVQRGPLLVKVRETGKVEPGQQAQIRSRVGGVVTEVAVLEGQDVRAGDVLLKLDPTDLRRDVERVRADMEEKQAQLRLANWHQRSTQAAQRAKVVSQADVQGADNELRVARARLKSSQAAYRTSLDQLRYATVVAPFDGRVIARNVQPGEAVVPGMTATVEGRPLLVLANTSELVVRVELNQIDFARVQAGQPVSITLDSIPGKSFRGKVVSLAASSSTGATGTDVLPIKVRFDSDQELAGITPGMVADVEIEVVDMSDVLLLPIEAVTFDEGGKLVHVWSDAANAYQPRPIKTGDFDDRSIEIRDGLPEGTRVQIGAATAERARS
jgi:RND family efflux transporter MFP subunit